MSCWDGRTGIETAPFLGFRKARGDPDLSFFDEDDEPTRTTSRTRVRPSPPPRRGRVTSGGSSDAQTMLVRRMIAGVVGAVLLLVLFFVVRACNDTRHDNALKDYNRQVANIGTQSRQTGEQFFKQLNQATAQSPSELYGAIVQYKGSAETSLKQANALSVPGDMSQAHQSLLISLELRKDGLDSIAGSIRQALGDEGEAADKAINDIAGDMRAFDASDVLYDQRVIPFIKAALDKSGIRQQSILASHFLTNIAWISPQFVASKLGQQLSAGSNGDGSTTGDNQPTGPGLHGTGLNSTSYGNVTLSPTASNRLTYVKGQAFLVAFTNQGDNDEFNVKVTLKISGGSGAAITLNKTVEKVAKGEKATVELPLNRQPAVGAALTINVTVAKVPGEEKTDNNKASYPTLFDQG
jgi:hypothetical protein